MSANELQAAIERFAAQRDPEPAEVRPCVEALLDSLERGEARAAMPSGDTWTVCAWVKQGILLAFRVAGDRGQEIPPSFFFRDRETLPTWNPNATGRRVRIVPGGTTVRRGAYLADGVVVMPPAYVNVGAYVGADSMIDSHALVGSCAQVGSGVHVSAAAQLGGVLEPIGALPVIVEDGAFVGGGCGIYEGTRVGRGAVLAPGVVLTRAVALYDLVRQTVHRASAERPLEVPCRAVVVPGSRPAKGGFARDAGLQLHTPVIVKYRDPGTDASLSLEEALR